MRLIGEDIVCISSIDWDFIWQGHQEIMSTLARQGNRVLFIENTGVRAPGLRDLPRLKHRLANWRRSTKGFREERDNLFVYSPVLLPFPYSRLARRVNCTLLFRALQRWMRATAFKRPILWTFLPTPLTLELMRELDPELSVYYCIDDFASSSPRAKPIIHSEARLFERADLVFVTSQKLRERALRYSRHVHLFPFAVDLASFERVRTSTDAVPSELRTLPRPIIGYVGGVHQWVDQRLLAAVARGMPEASVVLVGPPQTDVSELSRLSNVHVLGAKPHEDVPRYLKGFDVGLIPYRLTEYTQHVYPTKLNEYLAMGVPVVATDLPEIRRYNMENGEVVTIVHDAGEMIDAVRLAVRPRTPDQTQRMIQTARQNSWETRIAEMSALIGDTLAVRRQAGARWEGSLRRLYANARRRLLWIALPALAAYLLVFHTAFVWMAAEPLRMSELPRAADAIVVFAGGVGESGKAGGGYQERVKQAVNLYRAGYAPRMIFSSGYEFAFREAEVMKDLAVARGVPTAAIDLETKAANTYENVRFVSAMLEPGEESVLLVSAPYHMRRALLCWKKVAPEVMVIPTPTPSKFYAHLGGPSLEQIRGILHEYLGIVYYRWKGWI